MRLLLISTALLGVYGDWLARPAESWATPSGAKAGETVAAKGKPKKDGSKTKGKKKAANTDAGQTAPMAPRVEAAAPKIQVDLEAPLPIMAEPAVERGQAEGGPSLRVAERPGASSCTIVLSFPVGSANDPDGHFGVAAIAGQSVLLGGPESRTLLHSSGGVELARVNADRTDFIVELPPSELESGLKTLLAQTNAPVERGVVEEARRLAGDDSISVQAATLVRALAYQGMKAYEHPTSGTPAYLGSQTVEDIESFRGRYRLSEASLAIVGAGPSAPTIELVKKVLSQAKPAAAAPSNGTAEALELKEQTNQRTGDIQIVGAPHSLHYGWALARASNEDLERAELVTAALGEGGVIEDALARSGLKSKVSSSFERRRGPSLSTLDIELPDLADVTEAKRTIDGALSDIAKKGLEKARLYRAKRSLWSDRAAARAESRSFAESLAHGEPLGAEEKTLLEGIKAEDTRAVAAHYFGPQTRSLVETRDPALKVKAHDAPRAPAPPADPPSKKHAHDGHKKKKKT